MKVLKGGLLKLGKRDSTIGEGEAISLG